MGSSVCMSLVYKYFWMSNNFISNFGSIAKEKNLRMYTIIGYDAVILSFRNFHLRGHLFLRRCMYPIFNPSLEVGVYYATRWNNKEIISEPIVFHKGLPIVDLNPDPTSNKTRIRILSIQYVHNITGYQ